jgi:hypothetical protein
MKPHDDLSVGHICGCADCSEMQLVLDSEALLERLKIPAIRDAYPACRLYPAIKRAYLRYIRRYLRIVMINRGNTVHFEWSRAELRRFVKKHKPADAGRSPVSGSSTQSAGMGQGGLNWGFVCSVCGTQYDGIYCPKCRPSVIQSAGMGQG